MKKIAQQTQALLQLTSSLLVQTHIKSVICRADALGLDHDNLVKLPQSLNIQNLILVTHDRRLGELLKRSSQRTITIPEVELTRRGEARAALAIALLNGWVKHSERVVFLFGPPRSRVLDTLFVLRPNHELQIAHAPSLKVFSKRMTPEVFETLIRIALELAHEGREGRPVGTMFVLGDTANVLKYAQPMVLNPFKGYADSKKNILDPKLKETIREFAALDGAFVIRRNGVILAAGCHIAVPHLAKELPPGLGARHRAAAAITQVTNSIAITISQSDGTVRAFRKGEIFLELGKTS
jgi:DNA integrity scanning protein DisA with diadenylate cyclase activity